MSTAYIFSEKAKLASELVALSKHMGAEQTLALAFNNNQADELAGCGADGIVLLASNAEIIENNAKPLAAWLSNRFTTEPGMLLVGATPTGRDLAARTAGYLDCGLSADILEAELASEGVRAKRPQYGGAVVLQETLPLPAVLTVPAGRAEAAVGATSVVEESDLVSDDRLTLLSVEPIVREGVDLSQARCIVGVGIGFSAQEDVALAESLASVLSAGIGCTRGIAEERQWISAEQYLGLSGLTVSPDLYLAIGISGQVQHMIGVRDSKVIVAINKNEDAAIFQAADYGIVGDLYEVVPALVSTLSQ